VSRSATLALTGFSATMRFAISIPQLVADGTFDPAAFRRYLARAESLGFESAWTGEQVLGSAPHLDPMDVLTYAAGCTERLRLGCAVFVTPLHSPVHLAKSVSTLDQLSRGRLEVGRRHRRASPNVLGLRSRSRQPGRAVQ
jgi:alkanesulfonate monooxygenase SsuD/methylene tetrahydromethanopterin reductase-like flavin-dependent oxidoreductase (luciferase family)